MPRPPPSPPGRPASGLAGRDETPASSGCPTPTAEPAVAGSPRRRSCFPTPQVGELEKQLIGHIPRDRELADGREQDIRLPAGRDDHGAAVFAGATDRALTPGDH